MIWVVGLNHITFLARARIAILSQASLTVLLRSPSPLPSPPPPTRPTPPFRHPHIRLQGSATGLVSLFSMSMATRVRKIGVETPGMLRAARSRSTARGNVGAAGGAGGSVVGSARGGKVGFARSTSTRDTFQRHP